MLLPLTLAAVLAGGDPKRSRLENVVDNLILLESDEVPNATVAVRIFDKVVKAVTNDQGLFSPSTSPRRLQVG